MSQSSATAGSRRTLPPSYGTLARKLALHSRLTPEAVAELDQFIGQPLRYASGAIIAKIGDEADLVTFVREGFICRTNVLADGRRQIHSVFLPGDTADGETALLGRRLDNLEALGRCSVWHIPKSRLAKLIHSQPVLAEAFAREAAVASQIAREWVVNIGRRTATERVAHLFCELHARMEAIGQTSDRGFIQPMTQQDLADAQGLSAVHVNRVLQDLRGRGLIHTERGRLAVLDLVGLRELSMGDLDYLYLPQTRKDSPRLG